MRASSLPLPTERKWERLVDDVLFLALSDKLRATYTPKLVYCAMLFWVRRKGKKDGLAHFCFVDLYGASEHRTDKGEPIWLDDDDFEKWMWLRMLRSKRQWQRERARRKKNGKA